MSVPRRSVPCMGFPRSCPRSQAFALKVSALVSLALGLLLAASPTAAGGLFDYTPGEGLRLESGGGNVRFRTHGRLMLDGGIVRSGSEEASGGEVRRWRLSLSGTLYQDWKIRASYELAGNDPEWKDLRLAYDGFEALRLQVGQFQEPFSLEELTSSNDLTFMERALPNVFAPGYHLGAGVSAGEDGWTAAAGLFGGSLGSAGDDGWGASARFTAAPLHLDTRVLHLGAAVSYREPGDGRLRLRPRPEVHRIDSRLVDTRTLRDVASQTTLGLEAAAVAGRVSLQGEWMVTDLARRDGREPLRFQGGYVYASWLLTGETRRYRGGRFRGVRPQGRFGAWELALRYSTVDLGDGVVAGGRERNLTLGLNVYPVAWGRVMLNYVHARAESVAGREAESADVLQGRLQITF